MKFKVITAVATEAHHPGRGQLHLGLDDMSGSHPDDAIIDALITGARQYGETLHQARAGTADAGGIARRIPGQR